MGAFSRLLLQIKKGASVVSRWASSRDYKPTGFLSGFDGIAYQCFHTAIKTLDMRNSCSSSQFQI